MYSYICLRVKSVMFLFLNEFKYHSLVCNKSFLKLLLGYSNSFFDFELSSLRNLDSFKLYKFLYFILTFLFLLRLFTIYG